ncbi:MAG: tetratricopeptide repeat protein [Alphaproteobacteria bacterium]
MAKPGARSLAAFQERLDTAIARVRALHQAGKLSAAEQNYLRLIEAAPGQAHPLMLLGLIHLNRNDAAEALWLIDASLRIEPAQPAALNNRGNALQALGRFAEAVASYDRAIACRSDYAHAFNNRGNALLKLGRRDEALASYDQAIALKPDHAEAFYNRGNLLHELGRHEEAAASCDQAIALRPDHAQAHYNRGNALRELGRYEEALASYDRAIALAPRDAQALYNRGIVLQELERHEEAVADYGRAIAVAAGYVDAFYNRGNALHELGRDEEAVASYDRAIALKPDHTRAFNNRGNALDALGRYEEAVASYDQAIALEPGYARAFYNRGKTLQNLCRYEAAIASYERATAIKPDYAAAYWNKSLLLLLRGDFEAGWPPYEWRWARDDFPSPKRDFAQPRWRGAETLLGKTILLHAEQGLGDTIQFCRYAPLVAARGASVVLEVQPALRSLMASLDGVDRVVAFGEKLPRFDCHAPLLSLPLAFGTRLDSIPAPVRYLAARAEAVERWSAKLGPARRLRVGLVWSGHPRHRHDRHRSIALAALLPLLGSGAEIIGLQKEPRPADEAVLAETPGIRNLGPALGDMADTAALISALDLVIGVDTSVAHLAAALGKPVWLLLHHAPDWRWLLEREDSPWYPTARLFRQTEHGDWAGVIARVASALEAFTASAATG